MPFDADRIAASPLVALVFVLIVCGLFIAGIIVRGKLVDDLLLRLDRMSAAQEEANRLNRERLDWDRAHEERRSKPRAGSG